MLAVSRRAAARASLRDVPTVRSGVDKGEIGRLVKWGINKGEPNVLKLHKGNA